MPAFNVSPFGAPPVLLTPGVPAYLYGSWPQDVSPSKMYVKSVTIAADVCTLGVVCFEGNVPAVESLITVQGTQSAGGAANVVRAVLTAVAIPTTGSTAGTGTVSYAVAAGNQATTADAGLAIVPQPEVPEAVVAGSSVAVSMAQTSAGGDLDRTVTATCQFPTLPTTATVTLQGSMFYDDASFVDLGVVATVAGSAVTANGLTLVEKWLFYRVRTSGVTGAGTVICKIAGA